MERYKRTLVQFVKFGVVGLSNTAVTYTVYAALVYVGVHYMAANVVAVAVSIFNSFIWNYKFVFNYKSSGKRDMARVLVKTYAAYLFSGFAVTSGLLYILVDKLGVSKYTALFYCLFITVPLNYITNKLWAFRQVNCEEENRE